MLKNQSYSLKLENADLIEVGFLLKRRPKRSENMPDLHQAHNSVTSDFNSRQLGPF